MAAIYPVLQVKKGSYTATTTPAAFSLDAPCRSVNSSIIVAWAAASSNNYITGVTDNLSGSWFQLAGGATTNISCDTWISKNREGVNPSVSIVTNASTAGDWIMVEVADLSRGTTLETTVDPNGYGTNLGTSFAPTTNQYRTGSFSVVRTPGQFQFVTEGLRFSSTVTPAAGWIGSEQQGTCYFAWRNGAAVGNIATFQAVGSNSNENFVNCTAYLDIMKPRRPNRGVRPRPFAPGLAR